MHINPLATLRQLKGAPLSVLIALTIAKPRQVSSTWLMGCTGYSGDNITAATWYLKEFGYIDCDSHRSNWRLAEKGVQQLPLPLSMLEPEPKSPDPIKPEPEDPYPNFANPEEDKDFFRRLRLLHENGIKDPTATELCKLPYASYAYLDAHIQQAKLDRIQTRLLIHRIREKDDQPKTQSAAYYQSDQYRQRYAICEDCLHNICQCEEEEKEEET